MNKIVTKVELVSRRSTNAGRKICIVTRNLAGPLISSEIGVTNRALALVLRTLGYNVDILYTRVDKGKPVCARGDFAEHVAAFRDWGVSLRSLSNPGNANDSRAVSYLTLQHLLQHPYEMVFFDDLFGTAYYPLLARRTGNAELRATTICVTAQGSTQWESNLNSGQVIATLEKVRLVEMERRSIELADAVKAPSAYILEKYRDYGWTIPEESIILANFLSLERSPGKFRKRTVVDEIVFFDRLEARKGLWMFCAALDRLKYKLEGRQVTFLGEARVQNGSSAAEALVKHSATWPFPIKLITNFDHNQAMAYLKRDGRLAVMPAPEDNSPSAILQCLEEGIPFLASSGSGGEELLDKESRTSNLFEPTVERLCAKLLDSFEKGAVTACASFDQEQLRSTFADWIERLLKSSDARPAPTSKHSKSILVVIIPPELRPDQAAVELLQIFRTYEGKIQIEALTMIPKQLQEQLAFHHEMSTINVSDINDFAKIAGPIASGEPAVVALCHITQTPPPAWMERARACFAIEKGISALTGMVATKREPNPRIREAEVPSLDHDIDRYLMGYASALFPLAEETNSGFMLMRSELLAKFSHLGPLDQQYDRPKRMQDWIHEVLVTLHCSGDRFELIPDLPIDRAVKETPFEVFRLAEFMRSLPGTLYGYAPGSEQWILARLAIDTGLKLERSLAHETYYRDIERRTGIKIERLPAWSPMAKQALQLAKLAHANGQFDFAVDLCANVAIQDQEFKPLSLGEYLGAAAANEIVNIVEVAAGSADWTATQASDVRIWGEWDERKIEMTVNNARSGLTAIQFPSVDLSKVSRFTSTIEVPKEKADPVRFKIELMSQDKRHHWSAEKIVQGGEASIWEIEFPSDLSDECTLVLGVEMVSWDSLPGEVARWVNPRFTRRLGESE